MELLTKALDNADVLVTTGGVSMGEKVRNCYYANTNKTCFNHCISQDLLKPVLETDFGATRVSLVQPFILGVCL